MKNLYDEKENPLVDFLFQCNAKKRVRRKYIEWKLLDYSITQEYNSSIIYIRKKSKGKPKKIYFNAITKAYTRIYSCNDSDMVLKNFKILLEIDDKLKLLINKRRKLIIKKLLGYDVF